MGLFDKVGLANIYKRRRGAYLRQKQRTVITHALAMDRILMLYDEPISALDPEMVEQILQVIGIMDKDGMTQVIVSHKMKFA
jgi:polar amino acid transport system ATP-binding protein